jgi:hypothetical protein
MAAPAVTVLDSSVLPRKAAKAGKVLFYLKKLLLDAFPSL